MTTLLTTFITTFIKAMESRPSPSNATIVFAILLLLLPLLHGPHVLAQSDRDEIPSPGDLFQAEALVNQCLGTGLSPDGNRVSKSGNRMVIGFQSHETGAGEERFYVAHFNREDPVADWRLQDVQLHGILTFGSSQPAVHVTGMIETDQARLLTESVADLWQASIGPDYHVTTINTTRRPDSDCELATPINAPDGTFHEVIIMGERRPERPVLPPFLFTSARIIQEISGDLLPPASGEYKFNFREDSTGYPTFVSVDCVSVPINCDDTLDTLRTAIGVSGNPPDPARQRQAILAVLPAPYTADHIGDIRLSSGNGRENLMVNLEGLRTSATREHRGIVSCNRPLGSRDDWDCQYRFISVLQTLPGNIRVRINTPDIAEADVVKMVDSVRDDIANAFTVSLTVQDSGVVLNGGGPGMPRLTAYFDNNFNLVNKEYAR